MPDACSVSEEGSRHRGRRVVTSANRTIVSLSPSLRHMRHPRRPFNPHSYTSAMLDKSTMKLPKVLLSSVIRSTHQGESHGGVYLVDMDSGEIRQVIDWNDPSIDWAGRGADRGLRGIAFFEDSVYLAASDEIFVYDQDFRLRASFKSPYLKHCHEIVIAEGVLYVTSTGFDSILEYDIREGRFRRGYCLRFPDVWRMRRRLHLRPRPRFFVFDPETDSGPSPGDTCHVNSVFWNDGALDVAGTGLGTLWRIQGSRLSRLARIPYGSHNARPFRGGVLLNHTATDRIAFLDRRGRVVHSYPLVSCDEDKLINAALPLDLARPAFGRGLAVLGDDLILGGSSPATLTAYRFDPPGILSSINLSLDVRNAVHGLAIWPFDR